MLPSNSQIFSIFNIINSSGLRYTHFKSSEHLHASFKGKTDFDILTHPADFYKFEKLLIANNFKKRESTYNKVYPYMSDYLFYDHELEQLHHFHLHTKLIFGKKFLKHYTFPHENWIFDNSTMHTELPIKTVPAEFELFLLIFRAFIKVSLAPKSIIKMTMGKDFFSKGILRELNYLISIYDKEQFEAVGNLFFKTSLPVISSFIINYTRGNYGILNLLAAKLLIAKKLKPYNSYSRALTALAKIRLASRRCSRSWLTGGIKTFAIVGADGSGKSSSVKSITNWLNYKLSVKTYYLGRPKSGLFKLTVKKIKSLFNHFPVFKPVGNTLDALFHAFYRYRLFKEAKDETLTGTLAVFDRYPLREFREMKFPTDGPRLKSEGFFASQELKIYDKIDEYPDLVIVLSINYDTSAGRKPEHRDPSMEKELKNKISAIESIKETASNKRIIILDANLSQDIVLNQIKKIIWEHI